MRVRPDFDTNDRCIFMLRREMEFASIRKRIWFLFLDDGSLHNITDYKPCHHIAFANTVPAKILHSKEH